MTPDELTLQVIVLWAVAISTLLNFGVMIWNIFSGPSKKNAATLEKLIDRANHHEKRLASLEQAQRSLPTKEDFHALALSMAHMTGEMGKIAEVLKRMEHTVGRHDDYLRKEG